jgi:hypothetical protein
MKTINRAVCELCRYWQPSDNGIMGKCRVQQPQIDPHDSRPDHLAIWPLTQPSSWCGKFDGVSSD